MGRKDFEVISNLAIEKIALDPENARIRIGSTEQECIDKVLRKSDQMLTLMKSIASEGLSTIPILVTPSETEGIYIVKDGNRRITALKLLKNPELCTDSVLREKIISISQEAEEKIDMIECLSSNNKEAILKEVISRHSGAQGGAGQLNWSAYMRTLFLLNNDQNAEYKRAGQYCFWAEENGIFIDDDFPVSTLGRFIKNESIIYLGFQVVSDNIVGLLPIDNLISIARRIIQDFGSGLKQVSDVWDDTKAVEYMRSVRVAVGLEADPWKKAENNSENQESQSEFHGNGNNDTDKNQNQNGGSGSGATPPPNFPPRLRNVKAAWDRTKLFSLASPRPSVSSSEAKVKNILSELGELNVKKTQLSVAILLRGLIELSTDNYLKNNQLKSEERAALRKKVRICAEDMNSKGIISKSEYDVINNHTVDDPKLQGIMHIETLHRYIHRDTYHPNFQTLNTFWDEVGCFVRACWKK